MSNAAMYDLRESMRTVRTAKGMRTILTAARKRLADVQFINWPALEASLRTELEECEAIARARGLVR